MDNSSIDRLTVEMHELVEMARGSGWSHVMVRLSDLREKSIQLLLTADAHDAALIAKYQECHRVLTYMMNLPDTLIEKIQDTILHGEKE